MSEPFASGSPTASAAAPAGALRIRTLSWHSPLRWLGLGFRDYLHHPGIGLFYGICFWSMAVILGLVFQHSPEYTMTIVSGCLLVGPFLAMGLYDVSRRDEAGDMPALSRSLTCWEGHMGSMGMLLLVLMVLELLWGRASLVVFAVFFNTGMPSTASVLDAVFNPQNWQFLAVYLLVGSVFAALVYCSMAVSVPMILDHDTDAITAGLASFRTVFENMGVMVLWGALIVGLVLLALWPWGAGLLFVGPWLGHATWHAYREAVSWEPATA